MSGLHDAFDELVADVPVYGDLDRAFEQVEKEQRRRFGLTAGLTAAAAAAAAVVVLVATDGDASKSVDPVETPTPSEALPPPTDGSIYFAADAAAGADLTAPLSHFEAEVNGKPMDIYLSRQGQPVRRVIGSGANEHCPVVSPDGTRLGYLAGTDLVIVPLGAEGDPGKVEVRVDLTSHGLLRPDLYRSFNVGGNLCPKWSPDGRHLGYRVMVGDPDRVKQTLSDPVTAEVHAVSLDGRDRTLASFETVDWDSPAFAWSPDGDGIAFTTLDGVWRADGDRSPELIWRTQEIDLTQLNAVDHERPVSLTWSSRDELAFSVRSFEPTEPDNPYSGGRDVYRVVVVDARSGTVLLDEGAGSALEGGAEERWSPDGSRLVFTGPDGRILLHDRSTGTTKTLRLRVEGAAAGYAPLWSPDGQQLLTRARVDNRGIALVSFLPDGSSSEVRTPWSWGFDLIQVDDIAWGSR